jgi:hypothetical protein
MLAAPAFAIGDNRVRPKGQPRIIGAAVWTTLGERAWHPARLTRR